MSRPTADDHHRPCERFCRVRTGVVIVAARPNGVGRLRDFPEQIGFDGTALDQLWLLVPVRAGSRIAAYQTSCSQRSRFVPPSGAAGPLVGSRGA